MTKRHKIDQEIIDLLEEAEARYEFKIGSKHLKLFVDGRLVTVVPHSGWTSASREASRNAVASVRRHLRGRRGVG